MLGGKCNTCSCFFSIILSCTIPKISSDSAFPAIKWLLNPFLENHWDCRRAFLCLCFCMRVQAHTCVMCLLVSVSVLVLIPVKQGVIAVFIVLPMAQTGNYLVGCNWGCGMKIGASLTLDSFLCPGSTFLISLEPLNPLQPSHTDQLFIIWVDFVHSYSLSGLHDQNVLYKTSRAVEHNKVYQSAVCLRQLLTCCCVTVWL